MDCTDKVWKLFKSWYISNTKDKFPFILRITESSLAGFGGLKTITLEIYHKVKSKITLYDTIIVKNIVDKIEKSVEQELFNWCIKYGIQQISNV